jgi:AraC family transcriptional regulator
VTLVMPLSLGARRAMRREVPGFGVRWLDFAPATRLPSHAHPTLCIAVVLSGGFEGTWGRHQGSAPAGTLIVEPAGEPHANDFADGRGTHVVAIQPVADLAADADHASRGMRPDAVSVGWRIASELSRPDDVTPIALEGLALELLAIASRSGAAPEPHSAWLTRATELVDEQYARPLALSALAAEVGIHPVHLARGFRARHGRSVGGYLREVRVRRAAERLAASNEPIADIALAVGFADQSHMNRWFVRLIGTTPGAYRRLLRS